MDFVGFGLFRILSLLNYASNNQPPLIKKVLIIRTDGIGDILLTIPITKLLKDSFRDIKIDFLVRANKGEILEVNPYVNKIFKSFSLWTDIGFAFSLRSIHYDVVISPRVDGYIFNHLISFLINGRRRMGFAMKGGGFFLTDIIPWDSEKTMIELLFNIKEPLGITTKIKSTDLRINLLPSDSFHNTYMANILEKSGILMDDYLVGLNLFASHNHLWPMDRFVFIAQELSKNCKVKIIVIGEKRSRPMWVKIKSRMNIQVLDMVGKTTILELVALIQKLHLFVTVDSGPRHIANILNIPTIVLRHGADSGKLWGQYAQNEILLMKPVACSPCGNKFCPESKRVCMTSITKTEVLNAAISVFKLRNKIVDNINMSA
jgi:ADP-heptose:LPS heptosyltransferase